MSCTSIFKNIDVRSFCFTAIIINFTVDNFLKISDKKIATDCTEMYNFTLKLCKGKTIKNSPDE